MNEFLCQKKAFGVRKVIATLILVAFFFNMITPAGAQLLPVPGTMVGLTAGFQPPVLLGLKIHPENPLLFDFIVDQGASKLSQDELKSETEKLVKYFLAALTIPDKEVWVNLSPYEKDRIIPDVLGQTTMGKTMLEQDYMLKQLASSLTNPDEKMGQEFWAKVKDQTKAQLGTTDVPMNTFNKVWIVPQKAEVLESNGIVLVGEKKLKVMMADDYKNITSIASEAKQSVSTKQIAASPTAPRPTGTPFGRNEKEASISSDVFRATILPNIEKEINEGKTFANVRQIYNSVILAAWYKKALKESLLGKVYADKGKVAGVENNDKDMKQKIYEQYLAAFKKGVYNLIKEDTDAASGDAIPRKYFSGGAALDVSNMLDQVVSSTAVENKLAQSSNIHDARVQMAAETPELQMLSAAVVSSAATAQVIRPVAFNQSVNAIWLLKSLFNTANISKKDFGNFMTKLLLDVTNRPERKGGSKAQLTQAEIWDYLQAASLEQTTYIHTKMIVDTILDWKARVESGSPQYFSANTLPYLLGITLNELDNQNEAVIDHFLYDGTSVDVPASKPGEDQQEKSPLTQVIFGNSIVTLEFFMQQGERKLRIKEGNIHVDNFNTYVASQEEEVFVGRQGGPQGSQLKLAWADTLVSRKHFSVKWTKNSEGEDVVRITDGYAVKGSGTGTVVYTKGIPLNSFRSIDPVVVLGQETRELFKAKDMLNLVAKGLFAKVVKITVGDVLYNLWVENGIVKFQKDEDNKTDDDMAIREGKLGETYTVGRFERKVKDNLDNRIFILDNDGMSRGAQFTFKVEKSGEQYQFVIEDLDSENGTVVQWTPAVASSSANDDETAFAPLFSATVNPIAELANTLRQKKITQEDLDRFTAAMVAYLNDHRMLVRGFVTKRSEDDSWEYVESREVRNTPLGATLLSWRDIVGLEYFQGEKLKWLLSLVNQELGDKSGQPFAEHRLVKGESALIPITALTQGKPGVILAGNAKVNVQVNFQDTTMKITEGIEGADPTNQHIAKEGEEVAIGRVAKSDQGFQLKDADTSVSGTHFSVRLLRIDGKLFLAVKDGSAPKGVARGSARGTQFYFKGTALENVLLFKSQDSLPVVPAFIGKSYKEDQVSGIFSGSVEVTVGAMHFRLWVDKNKIYAEPMDEITEKSLGTKVWEGRLGVPFDIGRVPKGDNSLVFSHDSVSRQHFHMEINSAGRNYEFKASEDPKNYSRSGTILRWKDASSEYRKALIDIALSEVSEYLQLLEDDKIESISFRVLKVIEDFAKNHPRGLVKEMVAALYGSNILNPEELVRKGHAHKYDIDFISEMLAEVLGGVTNYQGSKQADEETLARLEKLEQDLLAKWTKGRADAWIRDNFGELPQWPAPTPFIRNFNAILSASSSSITEPVVASAPTTMKQVGGIDFDPTNMNLQIKRDGKGVPLPLPQQNIEQINIQGIVPVIINIVPINAESLPIFLGQAPKDPTRKPEMLTQNSG